MSDKNNNTSTDKEHDDLLQRAKTLQSQTQVDQKAAGTGKKSSIHSFIEKLNNKLDNKLKPFRYIFAIFKKISAFILWLAFRHEKGELLLDAQGSPIFSGKRLALISTSVLSVFILIHASISAAYYYSTQFTETVYVTGKQEIITGELYQFGGCTALPCSTANDNGKFYLIESSFYFPRLFYPEQNIYANIPQQNAACEVKGYGIYFRRFRWLYKSAQLYQHITQVSCRPYTQDELNKATANGKILKAI